MPSSFNRATTGLLAFVAIALVGVIATLATDAIGGPLEPPGAPASTRPIVEPRIPISQPAFFPIVINQPGSYYLASNITGVASSDGISIQVSGVTLDLNGFQLSGVTNSNYAIAVPAVAANITVRNGVIRNWFSAIEAGAVSTGTFEDLRIEGNTSGLRVGASSTVARVVARANLTSGIRIESGTGGGRIVDSISSGNSTGVVIVGNNVTLTRSVIVNNTSVGVHLFGANAWIVDNDVSGNTLVNFAVDGVGATITGNLIVGAVGFDIIGTNTHIGSSAVLGAGTVFSADVWSNIRIP